MLAAPWIADIGTLLFAISAPSLIKEFWNYSRYTRVMLLTGTANDQQVEISLHKGSRYVLKRRWKRSPGELGVVALSEPGTFQEGEGGLTLLSHAGRPRMLAYDGHDYVVADSGDSSHYNLYGWRLRANA